MLPAFRLYYEREYLRTLEKLDAIQKERILRAEQLLAENPRHPSLHIHRFQGVSGKYPDVGGPHVYIAYASQGAGALRIIFEFGPKPGEIALHTCGPHDKAERPRG